MYTTSPLSIYSEILTLTLKQLKPIKYKLKSKGSVIFVPRTLQTRLGRMKTNIFCFILIALLGITISTSIAQENDDAPKTNTEVETLQKRISELEDKLKVVENVEKMELAAKLAEAQAKLLNANIDKLKLELKDSNRQWLMTWIFIFLGVLSVVGSSIGYTVLTQLTSKMDNLIATEVEKRVDEFKESIEKVKILEPKVRILNKEHAASVLENFNNPTLWHKEDHPEQIRTLKNEVLLDLFSDKTRYVGIRVAAIEVMGARGSQIFLNPVLTYLESIVDSEIDWVESREPDYYFHRLLGRLSRIHNEESYQGIKSFLNQMINENPKNINLFLPWTVFALSEISIVMELRDSIDVLKKVIPEMKELKPNVVVLQKLAEYFDKFNEPEGIKLILEHLEADKMPNVRNECLELLEKHDPDFVNEQRAAETTTNTESE